jgi:hypothetical protein
MLLTAAVGLSPLFSGACFMLQSPKDLTPEARQAILDQGSTALTQSGTLAQTALTAAGQPLWATLADLGARVSALVLAWYLSPTVKPITTSPTPKE